MMAAPPPGPSPRGARTGAPAYRAKYRRRAPAFAIPRRRRPARGRPRGPRAPRRTRPRPRRRDGPVGRPAEPHHPSSAGQEPPRPRSTSRALALSLPRHAAAPSRARAEALASPAPARAHFGAMPRAHRRRGRAGVQARPSAVRALPAPRQLPPATAADVLRRSATVGGPPNRPPGYSSAANAGPRAPPARDRD